MDYTPMEILTYRMQLLGEEVPKETFQGDKNGELWEFMENPDPAQFSGALKARLDEHWPEWRKKML